MMKVNESMMGNRSSKPGTIDILLN